jgi:hypothetical protein
MKLSGTLVLLLLSMTLVMLALGFLAGQRHGRTLEDKQSYQSDMDAYCAAKMNDGYLSTLSADERQSLHDQAFFSRKLHTCLQTESTVDGKPDAMNFTIGDITHGFLAAPKWHAYDRPLHTSQTNYGNDHHLYAEGYWAPVSSDPGQKSVSDSNTVKLSCDYGDKTIDGANTCTETQGYTQMGTISTDTQTYHVASWVNDEVIATDVEHGLSGSTTTTLIIHPQANEIEVVDRTRMNDKQPDLMKGSEGKSFGDHFELHGGMYQFGTAGVFFQCDEAGVVTDMRLDVVERYHGDVYTVPNKEWNAGSTSPSKFTAQESDAAMKKKLDELR